MSVIYVDQWCDALPKMWQAVGQTPDKIFVLTDEMTRVHCRSRLPISGEDVVEICIPQGDENKTLTTLSGVWEKLTHHGATRHSLLICLGGGVVTDLGGFAAAAFKRGIPFVNVPTTLLAMVDAAVGGKTGINFAGLKNEVGAFCPARAVMVDAGMLGTLSHENVCSGFAEMLKHSLLGSVEMWAEHVSCDLNDVDEKVMARMIRQSIEVKAHVVEQDPTERGLRKCLNLGHTLGHAFESLALEKGQPVLHGYAVAWGLAGELYLSEKLMGFPLKRMRQTVRFIKEIYGDVRFECKDYDTLLDFISHDKKNVGSRVNFCLLRDIGQVALDIQVSREDITEAFDFLREGF